MKICLLARANYELVRRRAMDMARRGHDVSVITLHGGEIEGVTVHVIHTAMRGPARFLWVRNRVRALLDVIQPDVVDIHGLSAHALWATRKLPFPTVLTVYGPDLALHAPRSAILRRFMRKAVANADLIYASTPSAGELAKKHLGVDIEDRLVVYSWGVPFTDVLRDGAARRAASRARFGATGNERVVLHARHLTEMWRVREILEAIPVVLAAAPDTHFWFVYPPPNAEGLRMLADLKARARELGVDQRIRFIGPQPYEEYLTIAHGADYFLSVSKADLLASTLLEALAIGHLPILADLPAYHEVVENNRNGVFVQAFDAATLGKRILDAFAIEPARKAEIAAGNRAVVTSRYDEKHCTDWLLARFAEIARAKAAV